MKKWLLRRRCRAVIRRMIWAYGDYYAEKMEKALEPILENYFSWDEEGDYKHALERATWVLADLGTHLADVFPKDPTEDDKKFAKKVEHHIESAGDIIGEMEKLVA